MQDGPIPEALTFDDVLLTPGKSSVLPADADTRTNLTRTITLNIPIVAAPWIRSANRIWPSPWRGRAASRSSTGT